jgi:hypothetical protein
MHTSTTQRTSHTLTHSHTRTLPLSHTLTRSPPKNLITLVQGGDCPPSPPRSQAEHAGTRAAADGTLRATDWWGLPDDGAGLRLAGETW